MGNITNFKTNKTVFIPCDCMNEILMIEYDHELRFATFAIYYHNIKISNKLSLWQRIKYIIQIIVYGDLFNDQIVLNDKQLKELKLFISTLDLS